MNLKWVAALGILMVISLAVGGFSLWRRTRFS
jgi:hypothetical protein